MTKSGIAFRTTQTRSSRKGISILEVVIATMILGLGIASVGELSYLGLRASKIARESTLAQVECQTWMNEMIAGVRPVQATRDTAIAGLPNWTIAIEIESTAHQGLVSARVVARDWGPPASQQAYAVQAVPVRQYVLTRWVTRPTASSRSTGLGGSELIPGGMIDPFSINQGQGTGFDLESPFAPDDPFAPDALGNDPFGNDPFDEDAFGSDSFEPDPFSPDLSDELGFP